MELLIRLFRRETTSKEFIPVIDGLRFLAILMAVLGVSVIYYLLIEKPCMKRDWHTKLWQKIKNITLFGNKVGVKYCI